MTAPPDGLEVLAATRHTDTRLIALDDRRVLRTPGHPDAPDGNVVLVDGPAPDAAGLRAALADAATRRSDPRVVPRVVARRPADGDHEPAGGDTPAGSVRIDRDVVVLPTRGDVLTDWPVRGDTTSRVPVDDRAWHGVTVLQRHAAPVGDERQRAARARGGRDELLRWWIDGRRRQCEHGRARVLQAVRFGTPVGSAVLVWEPGVEVGPDAAGLAVLTDVVVHPAHRGLGVATTLVAALLRVHLDDFPRARIAAVVPAASTATLRRYGWHRHETLVEIAAGRSPVQTVGD